MTPYDAIDGVKDYASANLNAALTVAELPTISNFVIGSVDTLRYAGNSLFFLPDANDYQEETIADDRVDVNLRAYLFVKGVADIWETVYGMVEVFRSMVYGGMVSSVGIQDAFISRVDFFEGVDEGDKIEQRVAEITMRLGFSQAAS